MHAGDVQVHVYHNTYVAVRGHINFLLSKKVRLSDKCPFLLSHLSRLTKVSFLKELNLSIFSLKPPSSLLSYLEDVLYYYCLCLLPTILINAMAKSNVGRKEFIIQLWVMLHHS